jgi:hypothetical protein
MHVTASAPDCSHTAMRHPPTGLAPTATRTLPQACKGRDARERGATLGLRHERSPWAPARASPGASPRATAGWHAARPLRARDSQLLIDRRRADAPADWCSASGAAARDPPQARFRFGTATDCPSNTRVKPRASNRLNASASTPCWAASHALPALLLLRVPIARSRSSRRTRPPTALQLQPHPTPRDPRSR